MFKEMTFMVKNTVSVLQKVCFENSLFFKEKSANYKFKKNNRAVNVLKVIGLIFIIFIFKFNGSAIG